jgi:sporulation protein YlmC with PRC-barrel domain/CBS domain-containing protein
MLLLTDHLGQDVFDGSGMRIGTVADLAISLDEPLPVVSALVVRTGRRAFARFVRSAVLGFERSEVTVADPRQGEQLGEGRDGLRLARDVLDHQVIDLVGKRVARVGDVELVREDGELRAVAVEIGLASVVRRLGLRRLARRVHFDAIAWDDIHLASGPGHQLQLSSPAAAVHRLTAPELMHLVGRLPPPKGADVLTVVSPERAAGALGASRPAVAARLLTELDAQDAAVQLAGMPVDDAAAALRHVDPESRDRLLAAAPANRADAIRALLAHEPDTAGAIMNPDVRTARADEALTDVRARLARNPPQLEGLLTVVIVDGSGRPHGVIPVSALVGAAGSPVRVPPVTIDTAIDEVMRRFATYDVLAVPVVDTDGITRGGGGAIDDVLDLLLADRRPGSTQFPVMRARQRAPA